MTLAVSIANRKGSTQMLAALRKRNEREDEGFTLIELMVVVLIIAILLAIAIPTFLGARDRANDRAAQSSLRNALTAAKTIYTDGQDYTQATTASVLAVEPSLSYVASATISSDFKMVSVNNAAADTWIAAAWSKSGNCFLIKDVTGTGTTYAKLASVAGAGCTGNASATFGPKW
jgi:type IV pilus assembly protein PilA